MIAYIPLVRSARLSTGNESLQTSAAVQSVPQHSQTMHFLDVTGKRPCSPTSNNFQVCGALSLQCRWQMITYNRGVMAPAHIESNAVFVASFVLSSQLMLLTSCSFLRELTGSKHSMCMLICLSTLYKEGVCYQLGTNSEIC